MKLDLAVERAGHEDPALVSLHKATFPSDTEPEWAAGAWWVVKDGQLPVAFAGITPSVHWRDVFYLVRAGVMPEYRGLGLQRRLIRVRAAYARRAKANWLVTSTYHNMHSANSLIACGFRLYEPEVPWGATTKRYVHTGHRHHVEEKEYCGITVVQHPTLAARDAYAARGGWIAERQVTAITYHKLYGRVHTDTVVPEMLESTC